jgi:excisionase family DNA binding protein
LVTTLEIHDLSIAKYSKVLYAEYMEEYYSTKQIAKMLGVKTITVRRWITKGVMPAFMLDKEYRVKKSDFEKFMAERRIKK